jgi:hypothetical protein
MTLDFPYELYIEKHAYGGQAGLDAWCEAHQAIVLRDIHEDRLSFRSRDEMIMFALEFGGHHD